MNSFTLNGHIRVRERLPADQGHAVAVLYDGQGDAVRSREQFTAASSALRPAIAADVDLAIPMNAVQLLLQDNGASTVRLSATAEEIGPGNLLLPDQIELDHIDCGFCASGIAHMGRWCDPNLASVNSKEPPWLSDAGVDGVVVVVPSATRPVSPSIVAQPCVGATHDVHGATDA